MDDIRRFFLRSTQICILATLIIVAIFYVIKPDPQHYYQGSLLKLGLLEHTPSPRIILAGGSNVAWGIDSELLEQELGLPVINDGLDVHLGVAPLVELKEYIRAGDIIIISLEYYNFANEADFYGVPQYLADWVEILPHRIRYLHDPIRQAPTMYTLMLQRKINRQINLFSYDNDLEDIRGIYQAGNFNSHGDFIGHLDKRNATKYVFPDSEYPVNQLDEAYIFLENFNQYALSKGATVFYEAQANRQTNCDLTGIKSLRKFYAVLEKRTKIHVITNMKQLCYPDDYFFDTPYHLNKQGRKIRTERLLADLKQALASNK